MAMIGAFLGWQMVCRVVPGSCRERVRRDSLKRSNADGKTAVAFGSSRPGGNFDVVRRRASGGAYLGAL
jgi:hypothetical protein